MIPKSKLVLGEDGTYFEVTLDYLINPLVSLFSWTNINGLGVFRIDTQQVFREPLQFRTSRY